MESNGERSTHRALDRQAIGSGNLQPAPMIAEFAGQIGAKVVHVIVDDGSVLDFIVLYPRDDHIHVENVGTSDGCRGNAVSVAAESKYDFRELGAYLGNVGSTACRKKELIHMQQFDVTRRLVAEALGTAILLATVVGSGIMGERLADGNMALALLGNTLATGAILIVLILIFGPVSGGHFNPAVTLSFFIRREIALATFLLYVVVQVLGGVAGVMATHVMFELPVVQFSETVRTGPGQWLSEAIATFGLVAAILGTLRFCPAAVPYAVGLFISAGYWFTASTSFANPAITIARSFTDTFSGIQPGHAPAFILAQMVGAVTATVLFAWLLKSEPTITDAVEKQADTL